MKIQHIIWITLCILYSIDTAAQPGDMPMAQEPGKCYAKALIKNTYEEVELELPIYIGDEDENISFETVIIRIKEESVRHNDGFGGFFQTEQDALVYDTIQIVDTTLVKDYVLETYLHKEIVKKGGREWREVICGDKVHFGTIADLQEKLKNNGYEIITSSGILDNNTKAALTKYQRDNQLPIGQLDIETLESLGMYY